MVKNANLVEFDIQVNWDVLVNICVPRGEFSFLIPPREAKKLALDIFLASEEVLAIRRERDDGREKEKSDDNNNDNSGD